MDCPNRAIGAMVTLVLCLSAREPAPAQQTPGFPSISAKTAGLVRHDGFMPFYRNEATGTLWLEIPAAGKRALMFVTLATGLGSNPIGLDRGSDGPAWVARFDPAGSVVRLIFENGRSISGDSLNRRTVLEAFAPSTAAALPVLAVEGDRLLVDATEIALRDWNDVIGTLSRAREGDYRLARDRSLVSAGLTRAFPRNTEVESELTLRGRSALRGRSHRSRRPVFTLRQHISFVALPDDAYRPRAFDPRTGFGANIFKDYFQPIQRDLTQRWAVRHRLERRDPNDPTSPIVQPLVYYLDPGIPEPKSRRCGKAPTSGSPRSNARACAVASGSSGSRQAPTRWTPATTWCSGRIATNVAGAWARSRRPPHRRVDQGNGAPRFASGAHRLQHLCGLHGCAGVAGRHGVRSGTGATGYRA